MNTWPSTVERNLAQAEQRWKWLRFLEYSATVAAVVMLAILLLGGMKTLGWFSSVTALAVLIGLVLAAGLFAWFLGGLVVAVSEKERRWLAAAIEQAHAPLQDRLNTLVHLEQGKHPQETQSYADRIERQAQVVLARPKAPSPFSPVRPLGRLLVSAVLLLVTIGFYNRFHPLRAVAEEPSAPVAGAEPEPEIDIPPPETEIFEQQAAWGEVRITDPGRDVVVTRVETIPLQIEAAASDALSSVQWFTAVNGADELPHALPAPAEPRYAAYAPEISVAEFPLSDWDVLTYYAKATTEKGQSYRSEIYFVEVQPFREELEKMSGGRSGQCSNLLNELTGMIEHQQELIRQTYRSQTAAGNDGDIEQQAAARIAEEEAELAQATNHLGAKMAAEFDKSAIAEPLSRLEQAESNMRDATGSLRENAVDQSIRDQRSALAELSAARKQFQKCISNNPDTFGPPKSDVAQLPNLADALKRIAEFRDEEKAAQDFMTKAIAQQRTIARQAGAGPAQPQPKPNLPLAERERGLQKSLEEFQQQHPRMFRGTEKECTGAQQALRQAAEAMRQGHPTMRTLPGAATEQLEALRQAMQQETAEQQLGDAYRLKKVLDDLIDQFARLEREPDSLTQEQTEQAASQAQEVAQQLQKLAENQPTSEQFEPELREAVNEQRQQELQTQCDALCRAQNPGDKSGAAPGVKSQLQQMAGAFEQSAPQSLARLESGNSSSPGAQESLDRGLRQLDGLMKNSQQAQSLSPADEARQRNEALRNLQDGVRGLFGYNERSQAILTELERDLKDPAVPVDAVLIERLLRQLEKRRIEAGAAGVKNPAGQPATLIDPARLPPAYRRQIEKYFEKLSEQR